jgi:hypothetical protein
MQTYQINHIFYITTSRINKLGTKTSIGFLKNLIFFPQKIHRCRVIKGGEDGWRRKNKKN